MAVSKSGPMFLKAINCEGETKDKHFIADLLINTIQEIGPQKVVQVITDNVVACNVRLEKIPIFSKMVKL